MKDFLRWGTGVIARTLTKNDARILMYHRFGSPSKFRRLPYKSFERQMAHIRDRFTPVSLSELTNRLSCNAALPDKMVVVTIDDGYGDFYRYGYPILKKYNIPATIFLVTKFINRDIWLWFDALHYILNTTSCSNLNFSFYGKRGDFDISTAEGINIAWNKLGDLCLTLDEKLRNEFIRMLKHDLRVDLPEVPTSGYEPLTWDQILSMDLDLIEFGSHTCNHRILTKISRKEKVYEIVESKKYLETHLNRKIISFCYPNGLPGDFDLETIEIVKYAGYSCATAVYGGLVNKKSNLYCLNRIGTSNDFKCFVHCLNGTPFVISKAKKLFKKLNNG